MAECDLVAELPGERHFGGYVLEKESDGAARVRASRDAIGEISGNWPDFAAAPAFGSVF